MFGRHLVAVAVVVAAATPALAIGDGARAYQLVPQGTKILAGIGIFQNGNASVDPATASPGSQVSVDLGVVQYTHSLEIGGQAAALFAALPVGQVRGTFEVPLPTGIVTLRGESSGVGDIIFGGVFGIAGSPALGLKDYVAFRPGFGLGALVKITAPTGTYDSGKAINLGANRWGFQIGAPLGWTIGQSMLAADLTTIELLPSVTVFTVNTDPFRAGRRTQAALWKLEAHVTRNLGRSVWVSVDAVGTSGGKATTDGVTDALGKSSLELGATAAWSIAKSLQVKATYGRVVARNANGLDGDGVRVAAAWNF